MSYFLGIIWNPIEGIDLGFFTIRFYSLMWVLAFAMGWYVMKPIFLRENKTVEQLDKLFIYTLLATMLGARLGHVIFYQSELFYEDPLSILLPISTKPSLHFTGFAGLASHGAAIAIILVMYFYSKNIIKESILWILDRIVIPVTLGGIFIRIGNFLNSEIIGKPTNENSFLAMKFVKGEDNLPAQEAMRITQIPDANNAYNAIANNDAFAYVLNEIPYRFPAQLYEALLYLPLFILLMYLYWKTNAREKQGYIFGVFLILLWSIRFVVEFVKDSQGGFEKYSLFNALSTGQWLSIPFVFIGFYLLFKSKNSTPKI